MKDHEPDHVEQDPSPCTFVYVGVRVSVPGVSVHIRVTPPTTEDG